MKGLLPKVYFDCHDRRLLQIVKDILGSDESLTHLNNLLFPYLHPHGIKELAESKGLRMAYAITHLLGSLESAQGGDRLRALRSLREEVLNSADSHMRNNTGRVLLQIMKDLVRLQDDEVKQLQLAHDFRSAVSGRPRIIRRLLREHHLLEMPEEWNQVAFDGHVHDSSTKGRKSPSHLIMDAWIKGIRYLTVVYYHYVDPGPLAELLEAAAIMDVTVRIGVQFSARFRDRYVQLIWVPRGFSDAQDLVSFLAEPHVGSFMEEGRKVVEYQRSRILAVLREFNNRHRVQLNETYGLELPVLADADFLASIKTGQPSLLHLARFIHERILPSLQTRVEALCDRYEAAKAEERERMAGLVDEMNALDSEAIVARFLRPEQNPDLGDRTISQGETCGVPELLGLSPFALIDRLSHLHSGFRIILNLNELNIEDVIELLYDCNGAIGYLEVFNLKDYVDGKGSSYADISSLQHCLNCGNAYQLRGMIRRILGELRQRSHWWPPERIEKFQEILRNVSALKAYYQHTPLRLSIGSDSTGQSRRHFGMGFAVRETLPRRARKELKRGDATRNHLPIKLTVLLRTTFLPQAGFRRDLLNRVSRLFPGLRPGFRKHEEWQLQATSLEIVPEGNLVTLGGKRAKCGNGLTLVPPATKARRGRRLSWRYWNGTLKNTIKILAGFIPAAATFMYTQDWWLLVYLGTPIWFAVTGLRNVLQSVFGGGGIKGSPLLNWKSYVSGDRVADSLLYTGLSVPLLEYFVKTLLLDQLWDIHAATHPVMLYSVMSIVNGVYISGHNLVRGLPRGAVIGNLFRSILNIPLSLAGNAMIGTLLGWCGVTSIHVVLQQWASIISKTSSDLAAGIIEGYADRQNYLRIRLLDYRAKLSQLFDVYEELEMLFPEGDVMECLTVPEAQGHHAAEKRRDLEKVLILNALDLLYFWMYQPRAQTVCRSVLGKLSSDERQIVIRSQAVLRREKTITQMFADGIVGKSFAWPLAFYLTCYRSYLAALEKESREMPEQQRSPAVFEPPGRLPSLGFLILQRDILCRMGKSGALPTRK